MLKGILVVDIGTTKVHVNLIDVASGELIDNQANSYTWVHPSEGWSEVDALSIWNNAEKAVGAVTARTKKKCDIKAIGFSYIGDSLLVVDKNDNPIGNLILAMDERAKQEAREIADSVGTKLFDEIGTDTMRPSSIPAKLLWIKKNKPDVFSQAKYFLSIQQFINLKLGLGPITDYTMAGRKILLNFKTLNWSDFMCELLGFPVEKLGGPITLGDSTIGTINHFGKVDLGKEIPVVIGSHDSECGMIGLGVLPGEKTLLGNVSGTYDHIGYLLSNYPGRLKGFFGANCGPVKDSFIMMGANISGPSLDWFANTFYPETRSSAIGQLFDQCTFDGQNKVFITKGIHTGDGSIRGINLTTSKENLFKAFVEGLTFPLKAVVTNLTAFNKEKFDAIRIGGGLAKSDKWTQLRADIFQIKLEKVKNLEISSMGAALMSAVSQGLYPDYSTGRGQMIKIDRVFTPDPENSKRYQERYQEFLTVINKN